MQNIQTHTSGGIANEFAVVFFTEKSDHTLVYKGTETPSFGMAMTYRDALQHRFGEDSQVKFAVVRLSTYFGMVS
jgi:hypothetical protein